jgi:uncharacterized protein YdcH (DUF465 family)
MGYSKREFGKLMEQMNPLIQHLEDEIHWAEQEYLHGIQSEVKRVQIKKKQLKTKNNGTI